MELLHKDITEQINHCVIVELKLAEKYNSLDEAQLLNELKATGIKVGLLGNFGSFFVAFTHALPRVRSLKRTEGLGCPASAFSEPTV